MPSLALRLQGIPGATPKKTLRQGARKAKTNARSANAAGNAAPREMISSTKRSMRPTSGLMLAARRLHSGFEDPTRHVRRRARPRATRANCLEQQSIGVTQIRRAFFGFNARTNARSRIY
eukprot:6908931-Lingulodinium_polyedra.AAC.1